MITTAVQQTSLIVEVQGAPLSTQGAGDEFLAALTANVGGSQTQKLDPGSGKAVSNIIAAYGFQTSSKQLLPGELLARNTATAVKPVADGRANTASLSRLAGNSDLGTEFDVSEVADGEAAARPIAAPVEPTVAIPAVKVGGAVKSLQAGPVEPAVPPGMSETARSGKLTESAGPAKSSDATPTPRHKVQEGSSVSSSLAIQTVSGSTEVRSEALVAVATAPVIPPSTTPTVATAQTHALDGASLAQNGSKPNLIENWFEAGDLTIAAPASAASNVNSSAITAVTKNQEGPKELGLVRGGVLTSGWSDTATSIRTAILTRPPVSQSGLAAQTAPKGDQKPSVANAAVPEPGSAAQGIVSSASSFKPPLAGSVSSSVGSWVSEAIKQGAVPAAQQSSALEQTPISSQPVVSNTAAAVQVLPSDVELKNAATQGVDQAAFRTLGVQPPSEKFSAQVDMQRTPEAVVAPIKSEKTKAVAAAPEDATLTQSSTAQSTSSHGTSGLPADVVAAAPSVPLRPLIGTEGGGQALPVTSHAVDASSRSGVASSVSASTVHALGSVSVSETASAATPVSEPHRTLLATPTTLEVGVPGGTQGWLRIRAEVGNQGGVSASLTTSSTAGRELLHSQMPALNAFLHSERIGVTTTVADRESVAVSSSQAGTSLGSGSQEGSNGSLLQGGGAQSNGGSRQQPQEPGGLGASEMRRSYDPDGGMDQAGGLVAGRTLLPDGNGRWLNVRV